MFDELMDMSKRYGVQLLEPYQIYGIKSAWAWRESLPESQAGLDIVIPLPFDEIEAPNTPPMHISKVQHPVANILAHTPLLEDEYHRRIQSAAKVLVAGFGMKTWVYQSSSGHESVWRAGDLIVSVNPDTFTVRFIDGFSAEGEGERDHTTR